MVYKSVFHIYKRASIEILNIFLYFIAYHKKIIIMDQLLTKHSDSFRFLFHFVSFRFGSFRFISSRVFFLFRFGRFRFVSINFVSFHSFRFYFALHLQVPPKKHIWSKERYKNCTDKYQSITARYQQFV